MIGKWIVFTLASSAWVNDITTLSYSKADSNNNNILLSVFQFNSCIIVKDPNRFYHCPNFALLWFYPHYIHIEYPVISQTRLLREKFWKINTVSRLLHAVPTPASKSHMWSFSPKQCSIKDLNQQETKKIPNAEVHDESIGGYNKKSLGFYLL